MEQFNDIFTHLPQYRVIICRGCRFAIVPAHVRAHLASQHGDLSAKIRKTVVDAAKSIEALAERVEDVVFPDVTSVPVPHLKVLIDGFKCVGKQANGSACDYIVRNVQDIQVHCRDAHGWVNPRKRGGQKRRRQQTIDVSPPWIDGVHCQQFFKAGGRWKRLFEVGRQEEEDREGGELERLVIQQGQKEFESSWAEIEEEKKKRTVDGEPSRYEANAWLKRTGWAQHLAGIQREWLATLIDAAGERERGLGQVCKAIERVMFQAQKVSQANVVGSPAMNYINRREFGGESNERPFYSQQMSKTIVKYAGPWTSIFRYIWRTHQMNEATVPREGEGNNRENEENKRRPAYRLTVSQERRLVKIKELVAMDQSDDEGVDVWSLDGGDSNDDDGQSASEDEGLTEEEEKELDGRVLAFWIALLDHDVKDTEYRSALVSGLAILGIDEQCGWKSALRYTPTLSAVATVAKMLVLLQAKKEREVAVKRLMEDNGWDQETAEDIAPSHFDLVGEMARRFMGLTSYQGRPSPMDWMLRLRTYGMKIRYNTTEDGVVDWVGDKVLFGHISFTMADMRSMIHGLVETAKRELYKDVLLLEVDDQGDLCPGQSTALPDIPWSNLVDNPAEMSAGWNLFSDKRNVLGVDGKRWLYNRILKERKLRDEFVDVDASTGGQAVVGGPLVWRAKRLRFYAREMRLFREHLLVLIHMTGGQPGRATELVSVQYKNSQDGSVRGVFVENGLMAFVTGYHKGFGLSGKVRIIHRYLPREVGELLFHYLWLVRPFWETIEVICGRKREESSPFIWEPKREKTQDEDRQQPTTKRRRVERVEEEEESIVEEERVAGEVESTEKEVGSSAMPMQAEQAWDTDRIRKAIQRVTVEWMGVKVSVMGWRHISIAIFRRFGEDGVVQKMVDDEKGEEEEDEIADLQAGHGSKIAGMIYGRELMESPFHTASQRAGFRRVSQEWHRFLLFRSALEAMPIRGPRATRIRREAVEEEFRRWRQMREVDVHHQLVQLVGEGARFRGIQEPALRAIMRQKSPIVGIMGTGAGKSVLFMLPAACSTGVTVVVVALISLREDLKNRCQKSGIECVEWSSRQPHEWASIVLVTPESAVSESFGNFINRQRAMGRLDRIVVDECHVVLDSKGGWRTRMLALRDLVKIETQLVYLTATMPPGEEGEFIRLMGLPPKEKGLWFRGSTTRKNVEYQVRFHDRRGEEETVVRLVEEKKAQYPMPGQIIVYCDTVRKAERLADVLGCVCFHRNVGSRGEKSGILKQLTEGRQQVFTATNALGLGVDAPTIRVVIHVGRVRKLRDYGQESGRAGRDGLKSEAIILQGVSFDQKGEVGKDEARSWMEEEMQKFVFGEGCMRVILDEVMDGRKDRVGCEKGEEMCCNCRGRTGIQEVEEVEETGGGEQGEQVVVLEEEEVEEVDGLLGQGLGLRKLESGRVEFEQEMGCRRQVGRVEVGVQRRGLIAESGLEEKFERWSIGCFFCRAHEEMGGDKTEVENGGCEGHAVEDCGREEADGFRDGLKHLEEGIIWEDWSGCVECRAPQGICQRWEDRSEGWGWRRSGFDCQYRGVLIGAVAGLWWVGEKEVDGWIWKQISEEGIVGDNSENVEFGVIFRWMGKKIRIGRLEGSKMCLIFREFG